MEEVKQSTTPAPTTSIESAGATANNETERLDAPDVISQPRPPLSDGGGDRDAKPATSTSKTEHQQSYSDICTPRTVVIHDVSDSEESMECIELPPGGDASMDMDAPLLATTDDATSVEQQGEHVENTSQEQHRGEGLPVSMHLPFKNSLSSGSLGGSGELKSARGANEIDVSGGGEVEAPKNDAAEHEHGQQGTPDAMVPVPEGPESSGEAIQASDLVVLAEEVSRLERELKASQAHVAKLQKQQREGVKGRPSKGKSAVPANGGESSQNRDAGGKKTKGGRSLDIVHSLLQGEIDEGDIGHLRSRLLRAENSIEIERQKSSKLEIKFARDSQMVVKGEKAVNDMAKVKGELNRFRSENEKLSKDLELEKERVELLRAQLSKLVAAGETQVEDQQRMQHGLEASTRDAREAREQLRELTTQHQALQIEARDLRARTEISEKVAIDARRELEARQKSSDALAKEISELTSMVQKQAFQIQQMTANTPTDQSPVVPAPESRPGGGALHDAQHHSPNLPDPPSTEHAPELPRPSVVEHDFDLVVLAQEVDRLEKELAKEKNANVALMEQLRVREKGPDSIEPQSEGVALYAAQDVPSVSETPKEAALAGAKALSPPTEPVFVKEQPVVDNGHASPSVTSQLTVLQPPKAQSQSKGWGFGLWGFIAGSDLVDE